MKVNICLKLVYLTVGFCSFLIKYSVSSLKSAVFDSPKVELTIELSLELRAPISDVKSMFNNLEKQSNYYVSPRG